MPPADFVGTLHINGDEMQPCSSLDMCNIEDGDVLDWVACRAPAKLVDILVVFERHPSCRLQCGNTVQVEAVRQTVQATLPPNEAAGLLILDEVELQPHLLLAACTPSSSVVLHWVTHMTF